MGGLERTTIVQKGTYEVPFMPNVAFVENNDHGWAAETFHPCTDQSVSQADDATALIGKDQILLNGKSVCADDPCLKEYAEKLLGDDRGNVVFWKPIDTWTGALKQAKKIFGEPIAKKWLKGEKIDATKYDILEHAKYALDSSRSGHDYKHELREAIIKHALANISDDEYVIKAADALNTLYKPIYANKDIEAAIHSLFEKTESVEVKLALLESPFFKYDDLMAVINKKEVPSVVKQEAVFQLREYVVSSSQQATKEVCDFFVEAALNNAEQDIQAAAVGTIALLTWSEWPRERNVYIVTSLDEGKYAHNGFWIMGQIWSRTFKSVNEDFFKIGEEFAKSKYPDFKISDVLEARKVHAEEQRVEREKANKRDAATARKLEMLRDIIGRGSRNM